MEKTSEAPTAQPEVQIKSEITLSFGSLPISLLNQGLDALIEQNTNSIEGAKTEDNFGKMEELAEKKGDLLTVKGKIDKEGARYTPGQTKALTDSLSYVENFYTSQLGSHSIVDVRVASTYLDVIKETKNQIRHTEEKAGWKSPKENARGRFLNRLKQLRRHF